MKVEQTSIDFALAHTKTAPEVAFRGRRLASGKRARRYSRMMPMMFRIQMNMVTKLP